MTVEELEEENKKVPVRHLSNARLEAANREFHRNAQYVGLPEDFDYMGLSQADAEQLAADE